MEAVDWEGAVNARRVLGDVYRMGRAEWLTERGWRQAYDDGVRTVIDLRNAPERARRRTDPEVRDAARAGIAVVHLPTEDPDHPEYPVPGGYLNHPSHYRAAVRLFGDRLADVFRGLAGAEGKVVVHCSAGRDRTGLVVSLLLDLAGRPDLAVEQDEAATRGINEWHRISPVPHPVERYLDEARLATVLAGRARALRAFLAATDAGELLAAHGLGPEEILAVRNRLQ